MKNQCSKCPSEAFRFCGDCSRYYCPDHLCGHLIVDNIDDEVVSGSSWLSNDAVIATFSDEKLREAQRRYESILVIIKMEVARRSAAPVRKMKVPAAIEYVAKTAGLSPEETVEFLRFVKEFKREIPKRNPR